MDEVGVQRVVAGDEDRQRALSRAAGPAVPADLSGVDVSTVDEDGLVRLLTETGLSLATMAPINATLDALPVPAREHLLKVFRVTGLDKVLAISGSVEAATAGVPPQRQSRLPKDRTIGDHA